MNRLAAAVVLSVVLQNAFMVNGDICQLPKVVGPCEALIPSYFFNTATQQCEFFNYGGCDGNANRFDSAAECASSCICNLPQKPGPGQITCLAYIPSYYYNSHTGKCEFFVYGGCGGNANRFRSKKECEQVCH